MKISDKDPATMTAGQINKELDRIDEESSKITQKFIDAGRGSEKPSETWKLTDPLAIEYQLVANRRMNLHNEIELRYGPHAPRRLPTRGFGPRKKA